MTDVSADQRGAAAEHRDDLDARCAVLGGASLWRTHALPAAGIPVIKMSDGPNGARGEAGLSESPRGVAVPVGIALGATWDPELVERIGRLLAVESHRRGAHVLLGPTVNLIRMPHGGRAFECYSEDPELTARLGRAWIEGLQSGGVAATVKHFVGNDTEVDRATVDVHIDEATLRELYLRPFEVAVREAKTWAVMSSYNQLDGEFSAHNHWLLTELLRDEWGFDGIVMSDWNGSHDTVGAANGGLNLAMPGPRTIFGAPLAEAVRAGTVDAATVDARLAEIALLAERTSAATLTADRPQESVDDPAERALCHEAAVASIVLVSNDVVGLPLAGNERIAVIGPNAANTRIMGGGSSSLRPLRSPSILEALQERFGERITGSAPGAELDRMVPPMDETVLRTPDGEPGLRVELTNGWDPTGAAGDPVSTSVAESTLMLMLGTAVEGLDDRFTMTMTGSIVPPQDGTYDLGALMAGAGRVEIGDVVVLDDPGRKLPRGDYLFGLFSEEQTAQIDATAGVPIPVRVVTTGREGGAAVRVGMRLVATEPPLDAAVALAGDADVAVVVVGTSDEWETEGEDRETLALPGGQDDLVRAVAAVSPRTIVVVNAGGPVEMPWLDVVDAVVVASFAGIETGPAVAAVLAGDRDPGGRLPVTYPVTLGDVPALPFYAPVDGVQTYAEGRLVGHRGFLAADVAPLFPFGHGLSFGSSNWELGTVEPAQLGAGEVIDGATATVSVTVTNTGERDSTDVVQVYVTHPDPQMPPVVLAGFAKATLAAGESTTLTVEVGAVALRRWDTERSGWVVDPGARQLIVARSVLDEVGRLELGVVADGS